MNHPHGPGSSAGWGKPPPYGPPRGGQSQPVYGGQGYGQQQPYVPPHPPQRLSFDRNRRLAGLAVWIVGMLIGTVLNIAFQFLEIVSSRNPLRMFFAVMEGTVFAFIPLVVYLAVPIVLDRYDPEPWWCLAMAFLWGAVVATGFAGFINTVVHQVATRIGGRDFGTFVGAVVSAPLCEEFFKGLAVLGIFYFLQREFDGVVDGIIYAIFCALGFAAVENVSYYARAEMQHQLGATFVLRGILAPWVHPLYTSMTGIGFGIARETTKAHIRYLAPIGGYLFGVTLHALWNFVPTVFQDESVFAAALVLWMMFVFAFVVMVVALVLRKGRTIRTYLRDEVLLGSLSPEDVDLICSPVGRLRCTFSWRGPSGRAFIRAGARLALSKWHTARAMRSQKHTLSADFILPLRYELTRLRSEMLAKMPR